MHTMTEAIRRLRLVCDRISQLVSTSSTPKVDPPAPATANTSSNNALKFKVGFGTSQEPLPFLEAIFIQEKNNGFALIGGDRKVGIHDYWCDRLSLKHGEKIGVVPTKRWDYVEPGCIRRLSDT